MNYAKFSTRIWFFRLAMSCARAQPGPVAMQLAAPHAAARRTASTGSSCCCAANANPASAESPLPTQDRADNLGALARSVSPFEDRQINPVEPKVIAPAPAPACSIAPRISFAEDGPLIACPLQDSASTRLGFMKSGLPARAHFKGSPLVSRNTRLSNSCANSTRSLYWSVDTPPGRLPDIITVGCSLASFKSLVND